MRRSVLSNIPTNEIDVIANGAGIFDGGVFNTNLISLNVNFNNIFFFFENCPNISDATLAQFELWNAADLSIASPNFKTNLPIF